MNTSLKGSRWWRFDIHTHTPASKAYKTPETTPEAWLKAAMQAQLDCVAITDHNSCEWVEELRKTYRALQVSPPEWFRELFIFPGIDANHLWQCFSGFSCSRRLSQWQPNFF